MKFLIPFLRLTDRDALEIEIPDDTEEAFRFKAAIEIAVKHGADLRYSDLSGANLSGANLCRSNLHGSNLRYSNLCRSDLRYSDLRGSNLRYSDLRGSNLRYSDLRGADLRYSDLRGSNLRYSDLRGADLCRSNLCSSDLRYSDLRYSDLRYSDLSGANLSGANLSEETGKLIGERPVLSVGPIGSRADHLMVFIAERGVYVRTGCFFGTLASFKEAIAETHGTSAHAREYVSAMLLIEAHVEIWTPIVG